MSYAGRTQARTALASSVASMVGMPNDPGQRAMLKGDRVERPRAGNASRQRPMRLLKLYISKAISKWVPKRREALKCPHRYSYSSRFFFERGFNGFPADGING